MTTTEPRMNSSSRSTPPPISIAYYSPRWPLGVFPNGIVTYVSILSRSLKSLGHEPTILADALADDYQDPAAYSLEEARIALSRRPANRLRYGLWRKVSAHAANTHLYRRAMVATLARALAERGVEIIEMEESFGWARWLQEASSVPVCVRLHGPWFQVGPALGCPDDARFRERLEQERRAIVGAAAVSAPSQVIIERTREFYGIELPGARVIPNPTEPAADRWRLEGADAKRILFIGRFDRLKGGDLILDAFATVLAQDPEAKLWFIGPDRGCLMDDGRSWSIEDYMRHRLPAAVAARQVEWLGAQPFPALAQFRRQALATVVCSLYETFPNTVIEAMALGCPVIASRVGGIPEIIQDQTNGLLHRAGDADDLAGKISLVLKNPGWAAGLGHQAALDCKDRYDPDVVAAQSIDLYQSVIARAAREQPGQR